MKRLKQKFAELRKQNRCAFISYICAGDPDFSTSLELLKSLPEAGCDIIEIGVPFLDPAGDGPIIERAAKRAIVGGMSLKKTLQMVEEFRKTNQKTPLILMTYYNPVLKYGLDKIFVDAQKSGVDGMLIVDLPLEEEGEILGELKKSNLDSIRLITPTTSQERAKKICKNASGFLYLVSMLGITGTKSADIAQNVKNLQSLRQVSKLPIAVGFGIKTPSQAGEFAKIGADGVIIGSTIVSEVNDNFLANKNSAEIVVAVTNKIREFAQEINQK
ncbi:MAG: tryptophan synthase subunit alpha [Rickettsiales bacterium]|nr:tryptophan synthase subunit alpha [Rickettsiales bacterium]